MKVRLQQIRAERAAIAAGLTVDAPDTVLLKRHYEALHTAAGNAHWARVSASLQARAILTDTQRSKVHGWAALRDLESPSKRAHTVPQMGRSRAPGALRSPGAILETPADDVSQAIDVVWKWEAA